MRTLRRAHAAAILAALIAACAPQVRETAPEPKPAGRQAPENFPRSAYEQAAAQGKPVYRVDPARSLVAITVRRGGSLARLGHDHVVASHEAEGYIAPEEGRADLYVPLSELAVDEPALRAEAGLDTQPSESDIAGTRANMLDKVLETQKFPFALIRVSGLEKRQMGVRLTVAITLHGVTRTLEAPAQIETGRDEMSVSGLLEFNQSDFGIAPFSILGGAIQVQDRVSLRFRIRARRDGR
jgi:polyisoprenoid-binding protein YceI